MATPIIINGGQQTGLGATTLDANTIEPFSGNTLTLGTGADTVVIPGDLNLSGTATVTTDAVVNGDVTIGDAATDTLTINADVASNIVPNSNARTLGDSATGWADLFLHDGTDGRALSDAAAGASGSELVGIRAADFTNVTPASDNVQAALLALDTAAGAVSSLDAVITTGGDNAVAIPAAGTVTLTGVTNDVAPMSVTTGNQPGLSAISTGTGSALVTNSAGTGNALQVQNASSDVLLVDGAGAVAISPTAEQNAALVAFGAGSISIDTIGTGTITAFAGGDMLLGSSTGDSKAIRMRSAQAIPDGSGNGADSILLRTSDGNDSGAYQFLTADFNDDDTNVAYAALAVDNLAAAGAARNAALVQTFVDSANQSARVVLEATRNQRTAEVTISSDGSSTTTTSHSTSHTFRGHTGVNSATGTDLAIEASNGALFIIQPNSATVEYAVTLPAAQAAGALTNDGSGNLSWTPTAGSPSLDSVITTGGDNNVDLPAGGLVFDGSVNNVSTSITAGTATGLILNAAGTGDALQVQDGGTEVFAIGGDGSTQITSAVGLQLQPYGAGAGNTTDVRFRELAANGTNFIAMKAPDAITADVTYVLPAAPTTNGQLLAGTTAGALSWVDATAAAYTESTFTNGASALTAAEVVRMGAAGTIAAADASDGGGANNAVLGVTLEAIAGSATGLVATSGTVGGFSGLTAGSPVFLSETSGEVTHTAPSASGTLALRIGYAVSATEVTIHIGEGTTNI